MILFLDSIFSHLSVHLSMPIPYFLNYYSFMLLLLLSHCSRVRLCATPWTAAHQAPPSLGFSRQEHWSSFNLNISRPNTHTEGVQPMYFEMLWLIDCHLSTSYQRIFQNKLEIRKSECHLCQLYYLDDSLTFSLQTLSFLFCFGL